MEPKQKTRARTKGRDIGWRHRGGVQTVCARYPWLSAAGLSLKLPPVIWLAMGQAQEHTTPLTVLLLTLAPGAGFLAGTFSEYLSRADVRVARDMVRKLQAHNRLPAECSINERVRAGFSMSVRRRQIRRFALVAGALYAAAWVSHVAEGGNAAKPQRPVAEQSQSEAQAVQSSAITAAVTQG